MAVYVLLSFEDDEEAKDFVRGKVLDNPYLPTVCGVFKKPTVFCEEPTTRHGKGKTGVGWTRGKKYGWWVCTFCGKPSGIAATAGSTKWELALGTNLLPPELSPVEFEIRLPGWRSEVEWRFLLPEIVKLPIGVDVSSGQIVLRETLIYPSDSTSNNTL